MWWSLKTINRWITLSNILYWIKSVLSALSGWFFPSPKLQYTIKSSQRNTWYPQPGLQCLWVTDLSRGSPADVKVCRRRQPFVPYALRNRTGCTMWFATLTTTPTRWGTAPGTGRPSPSGHSDLKHVLRVSRLPALSPASGSNGWNLDVLTSSSSWNTK